jgi:hypothetical protein
MPSIAALAAAGVAVLARLEKRNTWIVGGIGLLSLFGLVRYAAEVWKVMFQLGFKP